MITGQIIDYTSKNRRSLVHINLILFGRINKQVHKGRTYVYYQKGILHDIPYLKLSESKYFIKGDCELPVERIKEHSSFFVCFKNIDLNSIYSETIEADKIIIGETSFKTALEHWKKIAEKKGYKVRKLE